MWHNRLSSTKRARVRALSLVLLAALISPFVASPAIAEFVPPPPEPPPPIPASLKTLPVPLPPDLHLYVRDRNAAIALGKALFWDMQTGSDGVTACASCHFHAGADNRTTGQVNPGSIGGDSSFSALLPAVPGTAASFPFHVLADSASATSSVIADSNDVMSSQGVFRSRFVAIKPGHARELTRALREPVFTAGRATFRQVPGRNAPSSINAVYNLHNFWDGRANETFNGETPFGPADPDAGVWFDRPQGLTKETVAIRNASLASQAVGPLVSDAEMRAIGRSRADLGKKMLSLRPLGAQFVHPDDSVLGKYSRARLDPNGRVRGQRGLTIAYRDLIETAFQPVLWQSPQIVSVPPSGEPTVVPVPSGSADEYTQMEANFPLFFGLSLLMYESTLVSDDAPFDRYREGQSTAMTAEQVRGLQLFMDPVKGRCILCHGGPEFTNATVRGAAVDGRVELMSMLATGAAFYDVGYYNIGVRPQSEDIGRGGSAPFANELTGEKVPLSDTVRGLLKRDGLLDARLQATTNVVPPGNGWPDPRRTDVVGAFKTPSLRNVELTGPYFHNGGYATLGQVVEFYNRGADFAHEGAENFPNVPPLITPLQGLTDADEQALVSFLLALTDERVRAERAPFDHPQLFVPSGRAVTGGHLDTYTAVRRSGARGFERAERVTEIPAVGSSGRTGTDQPPLQPFLGLSPYTR